jgi:hypothetical protein
MIIKNFILMFALLSTVFAYKCEYPNVRTNLCSSEGQQALCDAAKCSCYSFAMSASGNCYARCDIVAGHALCLRGCAQELSDKKKICDNEYNNNFDGNCNGKYQNKYRITFNMNC